MPGIDFNRLRAEITMEQVLKQLGFTPTSRSGPQWHGPCPVHRSTSQRSRAFSVNVNTGRYYCHKCHSKGNQLELWAAVTGLTIYPAAIDLCHSLGHQIPRSTRRQAEPEQKRRGTGTSSATQEHPFHRLP